MISCPFCQIKEDYRVFYRDNIITAFLAKDAVTPGQSLIIPNRHVQTMADLTQEEIFAIFRFCSILSEVLISHLNIDGINIICNNGISAGQTIQHFHVHVVPRQKGDLPNPKYWLNKQLYERLYTPTQKEFKSVAKKIKTHLQPRIETFSQEYFGLKGVVVERNVTIGKRVSFGINIHSYPNTKIGDDCIIEDNVVIGHPTTDEIKEFTKSFSSEEKKHVGQFVKNATKIEKGAIIRSGSVIYSGVNIGKNLDCGHNVLIRERTRIGDNVYIMPNTQVHADVTVGNNVRLLGFLCNRSVVEDDASVLGNLVHVYKRGKRGMKEKAPIVKKRAIVGMGATIIGGIIIGENSIVGANAVVTEDVAPNSIVGGVPAKLIKLI